MSAWRVERHYGFGAAQIAIRPEAHRSEPIGFVAGAGQLVGELTEGGVFSTLRRASGEASALLLAALIGLAFLITLTRDHSDTSVVEVVMIASAIPEPPPLVEEPLPIPVEVPEPAPPKPVAPPPPPERVAELPKPPPPPIAKPRRPEPPPMARPRPKPIVPQMAKVELPKPPPPKRMDRSVRDRPQPVSRPRVAIDASRPAPTPEAPRMDRIARAPKPRANPTRVTPRLSAPAAPALELPSEAPPERAFRVASAKPTPGVRPRALPGVAPAPRAPAAPSRTAVSRPSRNPDARPTATRRSPRVAPMAAAAPAVVSPAPAAAVPERLTRAAPSPTARRAPRPSASMARVATSRPQPTPLVASRSGRAAPEPSRGTSSDRPGLAGVPLGDLAACLSDRDEDRLKQALVAAVTTQEECISSKGTYRFVETKNLNAFLMWIDRAPSRPVEDRCGELQYALECLQGASRRAAR